VKGKSLEEMNKIDEERKEEINKISERMAKENQAISRYYVERERGLVESNRIKEENERKLREKEMNKLRE
jgi:outer membrane protein assembly factor BamD (BamD/ComL family)